MSYILAHAATFDLLNFYACTFIYSTEPMGYTISSQVSSRAIRSTMKLSVNEEVEMYFTISDLPVSSSVN